MTDMPDLLRRLEKGGIEVPEHVKKAMLKVDVSDFTDYDVEPFFADRPIPFIETDEGGLKTISAPHMIATLLHHLEILEGQDIMLIGSKGGYMAAIIDRMVGKHGTVTIIEPHEEVREYTEERLGIHRSSGIIRVLRPQDMESSDEKSRRFGRIMITGSVREIPETIEHMVVDGGFVLGPFGGPSTKGC